MTLSPEKAAGAAKALRDQAELICREKYPLPNDWDEFERVCLIELQRLLDAK